MDLEVKEFRAQKMQLCDRQKRIHFGLTTKIPSKHKKYPHIWQVFQKTHFPWNMLLKCQTNAMFLITSLSGRFDEFGQLCAIIIAYHHHQTKVQ